MLSQFRRNKANSKIVFVKDLSEDENNNKEILVCTVELFHQKKDFACVFSILETSRQKGEKTKTQITIVYILSSAYVLSALSYV